MSQGGFRFLIDRFVRFVEIRTAFGMADNDVGYADIYEHSRRYFARKSAAFFPMHILRGYVNRRAFRQFHSHRQIRKYGSNDDFGFDVLRYAADEARNRFLGVLASMIHLPVAGNNSFSHESILLSEM